MIPAIPAADTPIISVPVVLTLSSASYSASVDAGVVSSVVVVEDTRIVVVVVGGAKVEEGARVVVVDGAKVVVVEEGASVVVVVEERVVVVVEEGASVVVVVEEGASVVVVVEERVVVVVEEGARVVVVVVGSNVTDTDVMTRVMLELQYTTRPKVVDDVAGWSGPAMIAIILVPTIPFHGAIVTGICTDCGTSVSGWTKFGPMSLLVGPNKMCSVWRICGIKSRAGFGLL
jgi:hypothetical protein